MTTRTVRGPKPTDIGLAMTRNAPGPARLEIHPKAKRNGLLVGVGCAFFALTGIWMMATGEGLEILAGLMGVLFFGVGGLVAVPRLLRRTISAVLTVNALEQNTIYGSAVIPWEDVENVGVVKHFGTKMPAIRLKTYDRYLENMSPELASSMARALPYLRWLARLTSILDVPTTLTLWSKLEGKGDPVQALKEFGKVGDFAEALLWNRNTYGYDVLFAWADCDRPAEDFAGLLRQYWQRTNL